MKKVVVLVCCWVGFSTVMSAQLSENQRVEILKNMDVFNNIFKHLSLYYVDSIDVKKTIEGDISYMLGNLDPYTEYVPEEKMSDFKFMLTGEYGGIGSIITMREGKIIINQPYEGMPAARAGLIPGDEILTIDSVSMAGKTTAEASALLKGIPNTPLNITYRRRGENTSREATLQRSLIHIDPVTYYGTVGKDVGYIYLSAFSSGSAAQSFKKALTDLQKKHKISSLIIDVRDNTGGSVEECLDILNNFLPKGETLLSMRGKNPQMDQVYRATAQPVAPDMPLVVLVNGNSASASEIVAGAIQDLDRGVVIGSRTYGKGLVQGTYPMPFEGQLKVTIAKYYIPSGRSIQAINYAQRDENGHVSAIPDSLTTVYYTRNKRPVRDGGGILPDIVLNDNEKQPTMLFYLQAGDLFFDFVANWRVKHPNIAKPDKFVVTDATYAEFADYVKSKNFTYDRQSEKTLANLKKIMEFEGYYEGASAEFQNLENKLKPDLERDLQLHKKQISEILAQEIMLQYYYQKGALSHELRTDPTVKRAVEVLKNGEYRKLLQEGH
ncbi:putative carboxy-terminal processing protease [Candidatus Symbiothrix dinenymphae]|nr:putative carboxy-terminal processing protease [Candidatus Symbiothrix dinenymphae]